MKKLSKLYIVTALVSVALLPSCRKALDIDPTQGVEATTALNTREGINASLISIYSKLKGNRLYGRDLIAFPEALADNGFATNKSGRLVGEARNVFGRHFGGGLWQNSYFGINEANLILEAVPGAPLTAAEKTSVEGQAFFLRALNHLNVALAFAYIPGAVVESQNKGGIPLMLNGVKTTGEALSNAPARASIDSVYSQIVADLQAANARLTVGGVAPFAVSASAPNFANKTAAQALLSRVNLYRKNFSEAKRWADSTLKVVGGRLTTAANHVSGWRAATHPETIFQIAYNTAAENIGVNESLQTSFTTLVTPGNPGQLGGFGDLVPTLSLLDDLGITLVGGNTQNNFLGSNARVASRNDDVRNLLFEPGSPGRGKVYIETTKFLGKNGFINLDNVPVIRVAEVLLNRAEAQATPGSAVFNTAAALADLNRLRTNRGLDPVALTGTDLLEEILRQRRIELAFEGHRFWDLKRLGRDINKSPLAPDVPFTDIRILAPIPNRDILANPNLEQNPGY